MARVSDGKRHVAASPALRVLLVLVAFAASAALVLAAGIAIGTLMAV